jgi:peptidoglycan-N-acetylglucosamine deacetylase
MIRGMKTLVVIVAIILAAVVTHEALLWLAGSKRPQIAGTAFTRVSTQHRKIALTFDDGPNPPYTAAILDTLRSHGVKATFFVVGKYAEDHPETLVRTIAEGHQIGNHTWSHKDLIFRSPGFIRREIEETDSIIAAAGYEDEIVVRAPRGRKLIALPLILSMKKRAHVLFDAVAVDWADNPVPVMLGNICRHVKPGSIILLHDGDGDRAGADRSSSVQLTGALIDTLKKQKYEFVTVAELMAASDGF